MHEIKKYGKQLIEISGNKYLNCYQDQKPSQTFVEVQFKRLINAFGNKIPSGFLSELSDCVKRNELTENYLDDSITNLIEHEEFPSIAKIINPQKKIALLDREKFLRETKDETAEFKSYFVAINIDDQLFYANKSELERNKISYKLWHKPVTNKVNNYKPQSDPKAPLSKEFSFIYAFNEVVKKTGIGELIQD